MIGFIIPREELTAGLVRAIQDNCEGYHAGLVSRESWDVRQRELWDMAASSGVEADVQRALSPELGGRQS